MNTQTTNNEEQSYDERVYCNILKTLICRLQEAHDIPLVEAKKHLKVEERHADAMKSAVKKAFSIFNQLIQEKLN